MSIFVNKYMDRNKHTNIIDVGSLNINGTYKKLFACDKWEYTGLDIVNGKNVDVVSEDQYRYPFDSNSFDVVVSGQTAEHVPDVYRFFTELSRLVRSGGYVCVIVPCEWPEHKAPQDCWRVLPDGMRFLLDVICGLSVLDVYKFTSGIGRSSIVGVAKSTQPEGLHGGEG